MGKPVIPKLYDNASVLFISINNFTRISSMSTAVQIVNFLNDLFGGFDAIIQKQDAYKVETVNTLTNRQYLSFLDWRHLSRKCSDLNLTRSINKLSIF